jgi:hypothetical protein
MTLDVSSPTDVSNPVVLHFTICGTLRTMYAEKTIQRLLKGEMRTTEISNLLYELSRIALYSSQMECTRGLTTTREGLVDCDVKINID